MNIHDLMIEEIAFSGTVSVASAGDAGVQFHWSGILEPGVEDELRDGNGALPDWFAKREVVGIGSTHDGSVMVVIE